MRVINTNNKTTINNQVQKININNFHIIIYLSKTRHSKKNMSTQKTKYLKTSVLTIGNTAVGKTCFVERYCDRKFQENHLSTIGIAAMLQKSTIDNKDVEIRFLDTSGQEKYKTLNVNFFKQASGIILMYSINERESFTQISRWMDSIREHCDMNKVSIVLIGNKKDLENERQVSTEEGQQLAREYNIRFFESSAKTNENVREAVNTLITQCLARNPINEGKKKNGKNNLYKVGLYILIAAIIIFILMKVLSK